MVNYLILTASAYMFLMGTLMKASNIRSLVILKFPYFIFGALGVAVVFGPERTLGAFGLS